MPRGRHRHSPPLHKLLPPSSVAAVAVVCAGGVWAVADPLLLRGLALVAGVAALAGAVVMRSWDREAGRRVAELTRARESDQWKTDERVAELEADIEEGREIRTRLDGKLRAKRVELARLRGEHAALLRRYATAETERASALEGRRRLAIAATGEPAALTAGGAPTPSAYLMASKALDELAANSARQAALPAPRARRAVESGSGPAGGRQAAAGTGAALAADAPEAPTAGQAQEQAAEQRPVRAPEQRTGYAADPFVGQAADPFAGRAAEGAPEQAFPEAPSGAMDPARDTQAPGVRPSAEPVPAEGRPALPARRATPSAIVPYARRTQQRPEQRPSGTGFDFFGTQAGAGAAQHGGRTLPEAARDGGREHTDAPEATDDADGRRVPRDADGKDTAAGRQDAAPEVIDLTEHDDTERLEVRALRSALGS